MSEPIKLAVAGLGTVGLGLIELLGKQTDLLAERSGRRIKIVAVSARDRFKDRGVDSVSYTHLTLPTIYSV